MVVLFLLSVALGTAMSAALVGYYSPEREVATWKPWTDDMTPDGHEDWMSHIERFAVPVD
jgi:hypothetical protein